LPSEGRLVPVRHPQNSPDNQDLPRVIGFFSGSEISSC
jgi:hypothetical protein